MWIARNFQDVVRHSAASRPVVVLTGARQTGKTSLVQRLFLNHRLISQPHLIAMNIRPECISPTSGTHNRNFVGYLVLMAFSAGLLVGVPLGAWLNRRASMYSSPPASVPGSSVVTMSQGRMNAEPNMGESAFPNPANSLEADILRGLEERIPEPVLPDSDIPTLQSRNAQSE